MMISFILLHRLEQEEYISVISLNIIICIVVVDCVVHNS